MANRIKNLIPCSAGSEDISGRVDRSPSLGDSIFYVRPPDPRRFSSEAFTGEVTFTTFRSISSAIVSANSSSVSSNSINDSLQQSTVLDSSASFKSSGSFILRKMAMIPPQPQHIPRGLSVVGGGSINKGFEPLKNKPNNHSLKNTVFREKKTTSENKWDVNAKVRSELKLHDVEGRKCLDEGGVDSGLLMGCQDLHWAQGRAGEDRLHIVICKNHGWVFSGIYDGFHGPDATDYLLNNLFLAVVDELKGKLCCNHSDDVLMALSEAMRKTEDAFLKTVNEMIGHNPELAMMGSCVLIMLMKGEDVYLMNVGDSRAVLATHGENPLQLTMDHNTNVKEEVHRIMMEHLDDPFAMTKGRVKGSLSVTRAFGAGFLKQPKLNDAVLEIFKVNYIGDSPYMTCCPSLYHHRLTPNDKFLMLSSDGLYQYFTNEEAVAKVESFITMFPDRDPAQLLIEETLRRAAKKAGMSFRQLLDIPQGERRLYHDDISIVIISLEGKICRSIA